MRTHPVSYRKALEGFLKEDIGMGDITTLSLNLEGKKGTGIIRAKEPLVAAGLVFLSDLFRLLDPEAKVKPLVPDGAEVERGQEMARVEATIDALLMGERTALNLIQRLSGIATLTKEMVKRIQGLKAQLVDTRKTTPGLRLFEKYAVRVGGAKNHRLGLYDAIMIKDNHIRAVGSVREAIRQVKGKAPYTAKIEVEVKDLNQLEEALSAGVDIVLLDNMSIEEIKRAVEMAKGRAILEASGGVTPKNIREIAETGVDYISCGFIVHHAVWKDINMKIEEVRP